MSRVITEEQVILHAQHLYLIYPQYCTLYDIIPDALRFSIDSFSPNPGPHTNDMVGFVSHALVGQLSGKLSQMAISANPPSTIPSTQTIIVPTQTYEVNLIQSTQPNNPHQPRGKKKNKKKKYSTQQGTMQTQNGAIRGTKDKKKVNFSYNIFGGDHLTHKCPRMDEIHHYFSQQGAPRQLVVFDKSILSVATTNGFHKCYTSTRGGNR